MLKTLCYILFGGLLIGCSPQTESGLSSFDVFCEMVANGAKPFAISDVMTAEELDAKWKSFEASADKYGVEIFRESDFIQTPLFSSSITKGNEVVLIYRNPRLKQYQQLKSDLALIEPMEAARRLGRLLGYSPQGINDLLMANSDFKTLNSFGVNKQITNLYYDDLDKARNFYATVLGLQTVDNDLFSISKEVLIRLHASNEEHPQGQPKSTAIAFLTNQLPQWYAHIQKHNVEIKYTYKPKKGGPHDGFVAIDPGGYLLEFEQFKQHPENELFYAILSDAPQIPTSIELLNFYGGVTWTYHNDLLKMQSFYEEELGFRLVADQGWTKIYQTSPTGFIGLVDERRGMMDYADEKAVEIEWNIERLEEAAKYFEKRAKNWEPAKRSMIGPEKYQYILR